MKSVTTLNIYSYQAWFFGNKSMSCQVQADLELVCNRNGHPVGTPNSLTSFSLDRGIYMETKTMFSLSAIFSYFQMVELGVEFLKKTQSHYHNAKRDVIQH